MKREEHVTVRRHRDVARRMVEIGDALDLVARQRGRTRAVLQAGAAAEPTAERDGAEDHQGQEPQQQSLHRTVRWRAWRAASKGRMRGAVAPGPPGPTRDVSHMAALL